jgi:Na+-transporting NADH:ubiquinone oxidoreductase subunit D
VLGFGTLLGISIMPNSYEKWVVMTMAPGAFFLLGLAIWISKTLSEPKTED